MSSDQSVSDNNTTKHPCCDCKETKKVRDECMMKYGVDEKCTWFIAAHKMCMGYKNKAQLWSELEQDLAENPRTPTKKPCCLCKDTRRVRDESMIKDDEETSSYFTEAHKMCLRNEGFKV